MPGVGSPAWRGWCAVGRGSVPSKSVCLCVRLNACARVETLDACISGVKSTHSGFSISSAAAPKNFLFCERVGSSSCSPRARARVGLLTGARVCTPLCGCVFLCAHVPVCTRLCR